MGFEQKVLSGSQAWLLEILGTAALENVLDSRKINSLLVGPGKFV